MENTEKKKYICEDVMGKKYKSHKWEYFHCECPVCDRHEHPTCTRCYENKE